MSIVTSEIASNVLDGIIEVHATRRNLDASTDERRCLTLTPDDISQYREQFKYNTGNVSDGKTINLNEPIVYIRIPVNIHMVEQNTSPTYESYVYTAENRAKSNETSIHVFVDGFKIPDSEIKFYPTRSNVDVFIPNNYLSLDSSHEVIVEKKRYDLFPYIHHYAKRTSDQRLSIELSTSQKKDVESLNSNLEKNVQIYINKKLYNSSRTISFTNNRLDIVVTSELNNSEVEIEFDPYVVWYFPTSNVKYNDEKNIWEISEDYIDSIHGPLSRFSCAFFINGLRVMNDNVIQKGRLHFEYDSTDETTDNAISFYLSDRQLITDEDLILYGKDYYLYNFIGTRAINNALHTTISGSPFIDEGADKIINFSTVKRIGSSKVVLTLPEGLTFTDDGVQKLKVSVYKTTAVSDTRYSTDDTLTEIDPNDYVFDSTTNPMTITITAPSSYMANGAPTNGVIEITSWYDWDYVLNDYNQLFTRKAAEDVLSVYNNVYDHSTKVAEMLKNRPYLMRTFLENYGYNIFNEEVEYDGTSAYVYLGLPDTEDNGKSKIYDISINNRHVPNSKVNIINKDLTDVFEIEGKYFDKGINDISIQIIESSDIEYLEFKPEDILDNDGIRCLTFDEFKNIGDYTKNIILLVKVLEDDEDVGRFPTASNVGYRIFTDYEFGPYDSDAGKISLIFDKIPDNDFIVYNKNFSTSVAYVKPAMSSVTDVIIPLYMGAENNPIPYIPRGKIYVYCGNDKYIEGVDYYIKTPEDDPSIVGSYLIMKRIVLPGSQVDIYFSNYKTTPIYNKTGYFTNNMYGLFYLNNLKYPFSTKYMNFYINGNKLSDNDIDILSDKLIRVHSVPVPMYDLVVESAFTVDDSELAPYITQYVPDKFEMYLARLFVGVDYSGSFEASGNYDVNDIYKSFIDTVDSVNKRPNPSSRDAMWIPSYNEDPDIIGPHTTGDVVLGEDINTSLIVGDTYIVGANNGKIASCQIDNTLCKWTPCNAEYALFDGAIFSNGKEVNNENILSSVLFHGYVIFGTDKGNLYAYGITSGKWFTKNELSFLNIDNTWRSGTAINGFIADIYSDTLFIYGDNGTVDGYDWENQKWFSTYESEFKASRYSPGTAGVMGNIYTAFVIEASPYRILVVLGENGEAASCYIDCDVKNYWIKSDSSSLGYAPEIYNNGSDRNYSTIRSYCDYFGYKVLVGDRGVVTYFDGTFFISKDNLKICNSGDHINNLNVYDCISYNEKLMVLGGASGKVSEYVGESQEWYNCDRNVGITSDGKYMENNDVYTMQITSGNTNYIIFAGQNGKVMSYNIDITQVPYRYAPYKSAFLEWYTTPGNAIIQTKWEIPKNIEKRFDMLLESNVEDGTSICIKAGDNDLMTDIDMNDHDDYPWTLARRRKFIADFIKDLPEGLYSVDQIYELYKQSNTASHMLYEEDLPVLKGGDEIASDDGNDINITQ